MGRRSLEAHRLALEGAVCAGLLKAKQNPVNIGGATITKSTTVR